MALGHYRLIFMLLYNIAKKYRFDKETDLCLYAAKFPSYLSSRSFLVADTDLCQFVSKIKVPKLPEFQKFFGRRY